MLQITGSNLIAGAEGTSSDQTFSVRHRLTGEELPGLFWIATADEIDAACAAAAEVGTIPAETLASLLDQIATQIEALGDELLEHAHAETALPLARLTGERGRTCGQLRQFSILIRTKSHLDFRHDPADPGRTPLPKPDLKRVHFPLGPVAVFGASNFPLAFSVAGGDTASALAAGCPVIVKAHPAHPGTSELVGRAITEALAALKLPAGLFSMIHGGAEVGQALVQHPAVRGVGFTGSARAGRALMDLAAARPTPIPVFAEMGSVNPVFLLPSALKSRGESIGAGLAASVTMGVGQFCTNPGVVVGVKSESWSQFKSALVEALSSIPQGVMLTDGIAESFSHGCQALSALPGVEILADHPGGKVFSASADFPAEALHEVFGPSTLLIECESEADLQRVAHRITGELTASIHWAEGDEAPAQALANTLSLRVGRLIFNGFPTGVEVSPAMQHGGPYPASSDARFTSVGTAAIQRWLRPVAFQDAPDFIATNLPS